MFVCCTTLVYIIHGYRMYYEKPTNGIRYMWVLKTLLAAMAQVSFIRGKYSRSMVMDNTYDVEKSLDYRRLYVGQS